MNDNPAGKAVPNAENHRIQGSWRRLIGIAVVYAVWMLWLLYVGWNHSAK